MSFDYRHQGDPSASVYPRVLRFAPTASAFNNPQTTLGYAVGLSKFFVNAKQAVSQIVDTYTSNSYNQGTNIAAGFSYSNQSGKTVLCVNGDDPTTATNSNVYGIAGIGQLSFTADISSVVIHLKFFKFWRDAKPAPELRNLVNNANSGYTPFISPVYVTGDMGSLLNYSTFTEGPTYASTKGGSQENDWFTASPVEAQQSFNFGLRVIVTVGDPANMEDNFGVNINDNYLDNSLEMQSVNSGDEIVIGMYANVFPGLVGRIEMYKWEDERTIVSVEFKT